MENTLTNNEIEAVRKSFKTIQADEDSFAGICYDKLFDLDPSLQTLFRSDMSMQKKSLMVMLEKMVINLDNLEDFSPTVELLAKRHRHYQVPEAGFDLLLQALLHALRVTLGETYTGQVRLGWTKMYQVISGKMKEIMYL